ncbi:MAG: DUF6282 family protein [Acidobacteriota bacterium]
MTIHQKLLASAVGVALGVGAASLPFHTVRAQQAGPSGLPLNFASFGIQFDKARGPVDLGLQDPALVGAIDVHAHLGPAPWTTGVAMAIDAFDFAKLAKSRGMRGVVQKTHHDASSASNAYLIRKHVEPGFEFFGRMPLNLTTGGINIATVEQFTQVQGGWGRIIEMPTNDAEYRARDESPETFAKNRRWAFLMPPGSPKFVQISKNGELLPEVKYLLEKASKMRTVDSGGRLALATGHSSGQEDLLLVREARRLGMQVTMPHASQDMVAIGHGNSATPGYTPSIERLQEAAKLGAFVELRQAGSLGDEMGFPSAVKAIRALGAESIIVSTDCGFMEQPYPTDCLALMARGLRMYGITEHEIDLMFKDNPAKLLDLTPWTQTHPGAAAKR